MGLYHTLRRLVCSSAAAAVRCGRSRGRFARPRHAAGPRLRSPAVAHTSGPRARRPPACASSGRRAAAVAAVRSGGGACRFTQLGTRRAAARAQAGAVPRIRCAPAAPAGGGRGAAAHDQCAPPRRGHGMRHGGGIVRWRAGVPSHPQSRPARTCTHALMSAPDIAPDSADAIAGGFLCRCGAAACCCSCSGCCSPPRGASCLRPLRFGRSSAAAPIARGALVGRGCLWGDAQRLFLCLGYVKRLLPRLHTRLMHVVLCVWSALGAKR